MDDPARSDGRDPGLARSAAGELVIVYQDRISDPMGGLFQDLWMVKGTWD